MNVAHAPTPGRIAIVAALLLSGLTAGGTAQAAPPGAAMPAASAAPALPADIAAKVEQHNKELHDQLQITPQQQPQWNRFAAVTASNAADIGQAFDERGSRLDTMDALQNMQSFAHVAQVHAANMQKAADAFGALYATFSGEQKQLADTVFRNKLAARSPTGRKQHAG